MSGYVRVRNGRLALDGRPFYFLGTNAYDLMVLAATGRRHEVSRLLDICRAMGLSVIRTWAFFDGPEGLQREPGRLDDNYAAALDFVIVEISKRGMKVLPVLLNYWEDYGGMMQYVKWAWGSSSRSEDFYNSPRAIQMFLDYMSIIISRRNHISGLYYRDDPAIMAWSIVNEPRNQGDASASVLEEFLRRACRHAKSLDGNHLVTHGEEGFYGPSTPDLMSQNPFDTWDLGTDFYRHFDIPEVDFTSVHVWVDDWGVDKRGPQAESEFTKRWIATHGILSSQMKKPYVVTEFGKRLNDQNRVNHFKEVLDSGYAFANEGLPLMGMLFWNFALPAHRTTAPSEPYVVFALDPADADSMASGGSPAAANARVNQSVTRAAAKFNALRRSRGWRNKLDKIITNIFRRAS